ncbi:MAG: acetyl-CoA carboxylase biotin carboxylase subunit [Phycisphaerales bacterium]|nr:acetyl-CoA carboxylase biotin carboxylase subunit [Phycisphaerales bacterium]MCI0629234.1 acetyl-CoA carboxylase biotin carboxylase subunit [Phycisphaerales bacterium]MCI0675885.1 acetyl-CoA carboxylase biotin carboxylase subunit [Phycisphaerales bacterium]
MFSRILIANRGEIALRIIRAARELGIQTVCVYSEADADGPWLEHADRTVCIGSGPASDSYLRIDRIISAAEIANVDAIHPGYGFLAENAHFAEVCRDCHIEFIGPSPEAMGLLGDKISCKKMAKASKTPVFPGSDGAIEEIDDAVEQAQKIGYPVIVKASAGGGGRGMRIANNEVALRSGIAAAKQEAQAAFGNGAVYIEKFLENARHVEIQVLGDKHGNAIHLYNRDCTSQRRHQKLVEEGPAPDVDAKVRDAVARSAAELIRKAEYSGAATVEFLMDAKQNFYMLEVNTRVQVEHPVTEMITGVDIVKEMIKVAAGEPLSIRQRDVQMNGHAIECRINAEDPERNFMPQAGLVEVFIQPGGPGVRVDTHMRGGYRIPPNYDSMIGKLIVHAPTRAQAIAKMRGALDEFRIAPIKTTIPLHRRIMDSKPFIDADFDIHYIERLLKQGALIGSPAAPSKASDARSHRR